MSYTFDRCEALKGADYVLSTIGVGGRRAWQYDVLIPRKYGKQNMYDSSIRIPFIQGEEDAKKERVFLSSWIYREW